jgi:adenylate cyclase
VIGCLVFLLVAAAWRRRVFESLELRTYDRLVVSSATDDGPDPRIVLIEVTEADIQALGHWPLTDSEVADAVERLHRLRPRAIALDMYRDIEVRDPSGESGRARLAAVFRQYPHTIATMKFGGPHPPSIPPPAFLDGTRQVGFSDIVIDGDGNVRRALLYMEAHGTVVSSVALRAALMYLAAGGILPQPDASNPAYLRLGAATFRPLQASDSGYVRPDVRGYQIMLDFAGAAPFRAWSLSALMSGDVAPSDIADRVVLVGVTAESVPDEFFVSHAPLHGARPATRGLVLHASVVSQLLRGALAGQRPIVPIQIWQEAVLLGLCSMLGAMLGLWTRSAARLLCVLAAGLTMQVALGTLALNARRWVPIVPAGAAWSLAMAGVTASRAGQERRQRALLMQLFRSQVSPEIAEAIWQERDQVLVHGRVRPQRLTATVLFCDLCEFTPRAEKLDPASLQDWLNEHLSAMAHEVMRHGGVVDKYIGDALMAVFGVPIPRTSADAIGRDAVNAVATALAMAKRLEELNTGWSQRGLATRMRIGIFTGPVVAGSLGPADRLEYTVVGDTVNAAARLESTRDPALDLARADPCRILAGEPTVRLLDTTFVLADIGTIEVKGKEERLKVWQVLGRSQTEDGAREEQNEPQSRCDRSDAVTAGTRAGDLVGRGGMRSAADSEPTGSTGARGGHDH